MTKNVIGYFCGTGYDINDTNPDAGFASIQSALTDDTTLLGYDGCQIHGGGVFAYGVEEQADAFIKDLKDKLEGSSENEDIQVNLVAHSRGCLSALLAIKKIQADPFLKNRVKVTADLRDPVPGNFQITTAFVGNLASANQLVDLSDCDIVKKVYITLQEKPILPIAFDALVSIFPPNTDVEIETLPGYHDVQQRHWSAPGFDHYMLLQLGNAKTLSILRDDGHQLADGIESFMTLEEQQLRAYDSLVAWAKQREAPFEERDLHFGGRLVANNDAKGELNVINWRHAQLKEIAPKHVLYGTTQPHYNHRKSPLEYYCDLTQSLDKYLVKYPEQKELVDTLKNCSSQFLDGTLLLQDYKNHCQDALQAASVNDSNIIKAINYMCLPAYFEELDKTISAHVIPESLLYENLRKLRQELAIELATEIESGKTMKQIQQSNAIKVATNTKGFVESLYTGTLSPEQMVEKANQYASDNIRLGRNWSLGSKAIVGALVCVAAAAVGCIIGAAIGLGIGFACGAITGPGSLITAIVGAFIGGFKGAMIGATASGAVVGLGIGAYAANVFFKPSPSEKQVQALANTVKEQIKLKTDTEVEPEQDEKGSGLSPI